MDRRQFVRLSAAAAAVSGFESRAASQSPAAADEQLRALLDVFLDETLNENPEFATLWGLDTGKHASARASLNDYSAPGRTRAIALTQSRLRRLRRIERAALSPSSQVDYDVVSWQLEHIVQGGERFGFGECVWNSDIAPYSPYVFSQLSGPYQDVPDFLDSQHPVRTAADAEAYLARLEAFGPALDSATEAHRLDAAQGVLAPDFALDTSIGQLNQLRAAAPEANTLTTSLARRAVSAGIGGDWRARAAAVLKDKVYPALDRQLSVAQELRAKATHDAGVWKLRDGDTYYREALTFETTTEHTPEDVHRLGLEQVAEFSAELEPLLRAQGLSSGSVGARINVLSTRPDQFYPNNDAGRLALLNSLNGLVQAMRTRLPRVFFTVPTAPIDIVRVPLSIQDGAANAYAEWPSLDGSRAGRVYVNLKDTGDWPKLTLPTLVYHEAVPGHQWQGAIAFSSSTLPVYRRVTSMFSGYLEGWALYAEQLADELGAYDNDPLGRIGYLQSMLFRAMRLVVDTGMHALGWSRERAIDYMVDKTALPRPRVQREIDRYCIWPGQACTYKIGHAEWLRARELVKKRAGAHFDLAKFHEVLHQGPMPLMLLERVARIMTTA